MKSCVTNDVVCNRYRLCFLAKIWKNMLSVMYNSEIKLALKVHVIYF